MCRNQTHFSFQCFILSSLLKGMFRDIWVVLPIYAVNLGVVGVALLEDCKRVIGGGDLPLLVPDPPPPALPSRHQPLQHHPSTCSDSTVQVHVQRGEALPWCQQTLLQHHLPPSPRASCSSSAGLTWTADGERGEREQTRRRSERGVWSVHATRQPKTIRMPWGTCILRAPPCKKNQEGQQMVLVFFGPPRNAYMGALFAPR